MAERPKVVNIRHEPYASDPSLYVYVGRAGKGQDGYFGNPHTLGKPCRECGGKVHGRAECLALFSRYFRERVENDGEFYSRVVALAGKTLGCFCVKKDGSGDCHAKIIADFVAWQPEGAKDLSIDGDPLCPRCECCSMSREECDACGGEGIGDAHESGSLDFDSDETVQCSACEGDGHWWYCVCNAEGKHGYLTPPAPE